MTDFKKSFWRKTVTSDCKFSEADFPANFQDGTVIGVDFSGLDISNSSFVNTTVQDCNFAGCNLMGVNFFGAKLTNCNFVGAKICAHGPVSWHTTFPDDVSGCVFDDNGLAQLAQLDQMAADGKQRAKIWMDRHPIRQPWTPGSKLDSPFN